MHEARAREAYSGAFILQVVEAQFLKVSGFPSLYQSSDFIDRVPARRGNEATDFREAFCAHHLGRAGGVIRRHWYFQPPTFPFLEIGPGGDTQGGVPMKLADQPLEIVRREI